MRGKRNRPGTRSRAGLALAFLGAGALAAPLMHAQAAVVQSVAVGPQYGSTHVYLAAADFDAFVSSFVATFGGKPSARAVVNVLPVPSSTQFQYMFTPVGTLSIFAFLTPIPYPFGQERTGYLVTDMDQALAAARSAGAEVIVAKFKDPIGFDAVIQWPGGVNMQLYWHFVAPSYAPLEAVPENRVYVSSDAADHFVKDFVRFSGGNVLADNKQADAGEVGRRGDTYRRISVESAFGKLLVLVTDGHLPYPFGHEVTGYEVKDLGATLNRAKAAGAEVLSLPFEASGRSSAIVEFPGGYVAEIHMLRAH